MKRRGLRRSIVTMLASVLAPCMAVVSGTGAFAATGDLIASGNTGDCTYRIEEKDTFSYTFEVTGSGAMGDYTTTGDYRKTTAPWESVLQRIKIVEAKDGVTTIGRNAFSAGLNGCYVEEVKLADSVTSVNNGAFYQQCRLKYIHFGEGLTRIGEEAFYNNGATKLHLPTSLKTIDDRAFAASNVKSLEIPDSVTTLGVSAFRESPELTTVVIGNGVKRIRSYTFYNCKNLTSVVIPASVTEIDEKAFLGCDNIQHLYYGGSSEQLGAMTIGGDNGTLTTRYLSYGMNGVLKLNNDKPVAGKKLTVQFSNDDITFDMETPTIQWQKSWDGSTNWTDLTGTVNPTTGENYYEVQKSDENYYIRAVVSKAGFKDSITTASVKVLDGIHLSAFSDEKLRECLKPYDVDGNEQLTVGEIVRISTLDISNKGIQSLNGIKYLSDLEHLYAHGNDISYYTDLSDLVYLENLDLADNNNLSGLNISGCRNLRTLEVENTKIKSLNLSDCPYLKSLHIYGTYIGKISIRSNPCLQDAALYGEKNDQSSFGFTIYKSDQGELRLSGETPLVATINEANFPSELFRKMIRDQRIDWDQDGVLSMAEARDVESLFPEDSEDAVTTLKGIEYFPNLTYLSSFNCQIEEVDLSRNTKLKILDLRGNRLKKIDVSMLSDLEELDVSNNTDLLSADVYRNKKLKRFYCWGCRIGMIDVSGNPELQMLSCEENLVGNLNVSQNPKLEELRCSYNPIQSLDLSKNTKLKILSVSGTEIKSLNVTKCPELIQLICSDIGLTKLDVSKNPKLFVLYCEGNKLATLDISASASLRSAFAGKKTEQTNAKTGAKSRYYMSNENSSWILKVDPSTTVNTTAEKTGTWKKDSKGWWYRYSDGTYPKNCWAKIKGKWYHFDAAGYLQTGWLKDGKNWYYLDPKEGFMVTGWLKDGKNWYYLDPGTGIMATGWKKIDGKWYFFSGGAMVTGWKKIDGKWYFFSNGAMVTGWKKIGGKWYFFSNGAMVTGTKTISGKTYHFDEEGVCLDS